MWAAALAFAASTSSCTSYFLLFLPLRVTHRSVCAILLHLRSIYNGTAVYDYTGDRTVDAMTQWARDTDWTQQTPAAQYPGPRSMMYERCAPHVAAAVAAVAADPVCIFGHLLRRPFLVA